MRFVATLLMWLVTTILVALAVPAAWAQQHLIDGDGYAALAGKAAEDPGLQSAMADELARQIMRLGGANVNERLIKAAAATYTASPAFPGQFAQVNQYAHRWLFTDSIQSNVDSQGRWVVDIAPMLSDPSFKQTLGEFDIKVPASLPIPLAEQASSAVRPGSLRSVAAWGPWVSVGITVIAGLAAVVTLFIARRRGKVLAALGVSGLILGAAGWAGIELGRRYVDAALDNTPNNIRQIAQSMISAVEGSMHQWLNITLIVGGGLVVVGVLASLIAGLFKRKPAPASP